MISLNRYVRLATTDIVTPAWVLRYGKRNVLEVEPFTKELKVMVTELWPGQPMSKQNVVPVELGWS